MMRSINLLPPEIATQQRARRRRILWIVAGLILVAGLAFLTIDQFGKAGDAEDDADAQEDRNAALQAEIDQLLQLEDAQLEFQVLATQVQDVLATDVSWGQLLNDIGRLIPDRVWLQSFNGSAGGVGLGAINVAAFGFTPEDVSEWIRTVASDEFASLDAPWVSALSNSDIDGTPVVPFSSQAALTEAALSTRAEDRIPAVP